LNFDNVADSRNFIVSNGREITTTRRVYGVPVEVLASLDEQDIGVDSGFAVEHTHARQHLNVGP
jgi:hypothetical protein